MICSEISLPGWNLLPIIYLGLLSIPGDETLARFSTVFDLTEDMTEDLTPFERKRRVSEETWERRQISCGSFCFMYDNHTVESF